MAMARNGEKKSRNTPADIPGPMCGCSLSEYKEKTSWTGCFLLFWPSGACKFLLLLVEEQPEKECIHISSLQSTFYSVLILCLKKRSIANVQKSNKCQHQNHNPLKIIRCIHMQNVN